MSKIKDLMNEYFTIIISGEEDATVTYRSALVVEELEVDDERTLVAAKRVHLCGEEASVTSVDMGPLFSNCLDLCTKLILDMMSEHRWEDLATFIASIREKIDIETEDNEEAAQLLGAMLGGLQKDDKPN